MKVNVLKYGGRGVEVSLRSYTDPGRDTVFWSPQRWREEVRDGRTYQEPAGGFNSFVCVDDPERGYWRTAEGQRVALVSINGIGEIRWRIDAEYMLRDAEGSVEHFGLTRWT